MKYICIALEQISKNRLRKLKEIKFDPEKHQIIRYKEQEQTIPLMTDMYAYEDKNKTFIFWNTTENKIVKFNEQSLLINAKFLDKFLTTSKVGLVGQLLNAVHLGTLKTGKDWSKVAPFIWLIIGGVMGFLAGGGMSGV